MKYTYKYRHTEMFEGVKIDVKANTLKDLAEKINKRKLKITQNTPQKNPTLSDFIESWLEIYKRPQVSDTWYRDIKCICNNLNKQLGNLRLQQITPIMLQEYLLTQSNKSTSSIKKTRDIINQIFKAAYNNGIINKVPHVEMVQGKPSGSSRSITDEERAVLLQVLDSGNRANLYCKLMLYCGLRPQEVEALTWGDIDFNTSTLSVNKAIKNGKIGSTKTKAGNRYIPIPNHFVSELEKHRGGNTELICLTANNKMYSKTARYKMWKSVKREMNIRMGATVFRNQLIEPLPLNKDFKLYYLRHTYCTDLELKGVPINIAKALMGHSDISITSRIYTHTIDKTIEVARLLIDNK